MGYNRTIGSGHVGAEALIRPAERSSTELAQLALARPDEGVRAHVAWESFSIRAVSFSIYLGYL
jgi:hypothetical protein